MILNVGRNQPEPVDLPEHLVAIGLDTNCMGEGRVRITSVQELAELIGDQDLHIEIWIPEPVIWEWAEHLHGEFINAQAQYSAAWETLKQGGFAMPPELAEAGPADVQDVVERLTQSLEEVDDVRILSLELHPEIARLALRDQTLQTGVGRRKSSVKTGAADSASFRLLDAAKARLAGETAMAVVSGDRDAKERYGSSPDVTLLLSIWAAKRSLVGMRTGSEIAEDQIKEAIFHELTSTGAEQLADAAIEGTPHLRDGIRLRGRELSSTLTPIEVEQVLAVDSVDVSLRDDYGIALVDAHVVVRRELQVLNAFSDQIEYDVETFDGVRATLEVSAVRGTGTYWSLEVEEVLFP